MQVETRKKNLNFASNQPASVQNHLLASLPKTELKHIRSKLEDVYLETGQTLYRPNRRIDYVYFPTTAVVSLVYVMEDGSTAAFSIVGNDGIVGIAPFMGAETVPNEALVQCAGAGFRIKHRELLTEFKRGGAFQTLFLRFTMALINQISQTAVCNRLHSVEKQLCRWLLLTHDRLDTDNLELTHDVISNILGISREGVSLATKKLKQRRLIENNRGLIKIIDRQGLEANVCECYKIVNTEYNRLLGRGISRTFR